MAPQALLGRYKLYKAGTAKLTQWLASTAGKCCDLKSVIKSLSCGLQARTTNKVRSSESPIEVRTQELLKLAEVITSSSQTLEIPEAIIKTAENVIDGRQECAEWYSAQALQGGGDLEKENDSHRYFILVLRKILRLLKEARAKSVVAPTTTDSKKDRKVKASKESQPDNHSNLFDYLDVQEPSDSPLGERGNPLTDGKGRVFSAAHFELEKKDDDRAFATWCFLQDLNDVRSYVRETWLEYAKGQVSFFAASSITDTAFGLLRCADHEFAESRAQSTGYVDLLDYLGIIWFSRGNAIWMCPEKPGSQPRNADSTVNIVELLCPIASLCLGSFGNDATEFCEQAVRRKKEQKLKQDVKKDVKTGPTYNYHEFCQVLFKLVPELDGIAHSHLCEHIIVDEFIQGLVGIHKTAKHPMWMVVACQVYLDIYDLLGPHIEHGIEALQETFMRHRRIAADVEEYRSSYAHRMDDVLGALAQLNWVARAANRFDESISVAVEGASEASLKKQLRVKEELGCSASFTERHLPAHAGAVLADLKIGMHDAGCKIANHGFFVLSVAHLYRAFRGAGLLSEWHDMDFVLSTCAPTQPLVAKLVLNASEGAAARHYLMALGVPAADLAFGKRERGMKRPLKEARKITVASPYLNAMSKRQQSWQKQGLGYSKSKTVEIVLQTMMSNERKPHVSIKNPPTGSQARESFTPVQLLQAFRKSILADEPQLNFDYATFTITCARLLKTISEQQGSELSGNDRDSSPYEFKLVTDLLRSDTSHPAVADAVKIFEEHIQEHGKELVKQAYDQSSGRIPKHLRPAIEQCQKERDSSFEMMRALFEYSGTRYEFSGSAIAAYHPEIKPEVCTEGCCDNHYGGETDPAAHHHGPKVVAFGSAIPQAIIHQATANAQKHPEKFIAARNNVLQRIFRAHSEGKWSESELRATVEDLMHLEIIHNDDATEGETPWSYLIPPEHALYEPWLEACDLEDGETLRGSMICVPVDFINKPHGKAQ